MVATVPSAVRTGAHTETPVTPTERDDRQRWLDLIDHPLIDWVLDSSQWDEPDIVTPSKATVKQAIFLATRLSDLGLPAPTRVVPDAHGGIVFERKEPGLFESIRVSAEGQVDHRVFQDCRLVLQERWPVQFDENV
jgi:hypothetical protein